MSGSVVGYLDWTRKRKEESADFTIFRDLKGLLHSYQLADNLMCTLKSLTPRSFKKNKSGEASSYALSFQLKEKS